jgi:hypothetical protein
MILLLFFRVYWIASFFVSTFSGQDQGEKQEKVWGGEFRRPILFPFRILKLEVSQITGSF